MPPVPRENSRKAANRKSSNTNANDTASLRRLCVEKGLPSHGRRNILISRLEKHAATSTQTVVSNPTTSQQPDDTRSSLLSEDQLAQIQSIVTRSVEESVAEIAGNAASAAVEAMSNSPPQWNNNNSSSNPVIAIRDENDPNVKRGISEWLTRTERVLW